MLVRIGFVLALTFIVCSTASAQSSPFADALRKARYQVFTADVNGDGNPDFLLKVVPSAVMLELDDELSFPLITNSRSRTFVIMSVQQDPRLATVGANNSSVDNNPSSDLINNPLWQPADYELVFGDVLGDGLGSMLARGRAPNTPSFSIVLNADGAPTLNQVLRLDGSSSTVFNLDLGAPGVTVTFERQNSDARTDMVVRTNGIVTGVYIADSTGRFSAGTDSNNAEATIIAVWNAMLSHLSAGNVDQAVQYMAPSSRDKYRTIFTNMGEVAKQIQPGLTNFAAMSIGNNIAQFVVDQTVNGKTTMNVVTFVHQGNRWVMWEF